MKCAHDILWENETRRLNREAEEREWQKLVGAARAPVWLFALCALGYVGLFGAILYAKLGWQSSTFYPLGTFFVLALGNWWAMMKRRETALVRTIAREAPQLAEKLRQHKVIV
jgi:hypothetical protein